ncbi:hypothetical protein Tco_1177954, partial [Tanacetum coccineum]
KTKRQITKESESSKKPSTTKEAPKGKAPSKGSKTGKFASAKEPVEEPIVEVAMDDAVNTADEDVVPGPAYNLLKGTCTSSIKLEYNFQECFNALTNKLDWNNPEGDCYPFDLSKPLPLYFINNDIEFLKTFDSEKMHTTSITKTKAIRSQMNKFSKLNVYSTQKILGVKSLGVENYQKKLNITAPQQAFPEIEFKELYTPSYKPPGVIYEESTKHKRVMRADELYKFSDETLKNVRDELHHRILNFHKQMRESTESKEESRAVELIDKQIQKWRDLPRDIPLDRIEVLRQNQVNTYAIRNNKLLSGVEDSHHRPCDAMHNPSQPLKNIREMLKSNHSDDGNPSRANIKQAL